MKTVVAYISAHGFGHWAQMAPVLRALQRRHAGLRIVLRTALPETILKARSDFPFELMPGPVDVGVIQRDAINEDIPATIRAVEDFHRDWDDKVDREAGLLHEAHADLVLSDIAPLAFAAADQAGIASIGIGSIDWHAIYTPLFPRGHFSLDQIAAAHGACSLLLRLPLDMPMPSFPRQRAIGLIADKSDVPRRALRRSLGLADGDQLALVMFGGSAMPGFRIEALADIEAWRFIMPSLLTSDPLANVRGAPQDWSMPALVAAADAIVCKPGYGIISEAWVAGVPLVYVPRPGFPEYPYLRDWLQANAPAHELSLSAFQAGDWIDALQAVIGSNRTYPPCVAEGAFEAAAIIDAAL